MFALTLVCVVRFYHRYVTLKTDPRWVTPCGTNWCVWWPTLTQMWNTAPLSSCLCFAKKAVCLLSSHHWLRHVIFETEPQYNKRHFCHVSVSRFIKYTGYGNAAGLLAARGLMRGGRDPGHYSEDEDSDTEEYREAKPQYVTKNIT